VSTIESPEAAAAPARRASLAADARVFQIVFLGSLLGLGVLWKDFSVRPAQVVLAFAAALATQKLGATLEGRADVGYRSALVTALGLSLLLRSTSLVAHPLAAFVAIGAKFVLRVRGKHLFNPANLGVVFAVVCLPGAWISPGQWGDDLLLVAWIAFLGAVVVRRAARSDVTLAFLVFHLGASAARVLSLGQSAAVWLHQATNGALLVFAFFMISDPMTIPNDRRGRIVHAAAVAAVAFLWQFALYRPNGLPWALFLCVPLVPLLDRLWPAERHRWIVQGGRNGPLAPEIAARRPAAPLAVARRGA
jgi:enediyne biosynthesis protein E5